MAAAEILYVGDVALIGISIVDRLKNTPIPLPNVPVPVTVRKPDGSKTTWTFTPATDGSDGKIQYTTVGGATPDLSQPGIWRLEPTPTDGIGPFASDPTSFVVKDRL